MMIDIIKHSFIAKFNDIKPIAYSEFLEELCKQVPIFIVCPRGKILILIEIKKIMHAICLKCSLMHPILGLCQILNIEPHDRRRDLTFVPIAPACVVSNAL